MMKGQIKKSMIAILRKAGYKKGSVFVPINSAEGFAKKENSRSAKKKRRKITQDAERNSHRRQHERLECFAAVKVFFLQRGATMDGVIREASQHGLTFRPASNYLEQLQDEHIDVVLPGGVTRRGIVRSTRLDGYGIQLKNKFSQEDLSLIKTLTAEARNRNDAA